MPLHYQKLDEDASTTMCRLCITDCNSREMNLISYDSVDSLEKRITSVVKIPVSYEDGLPSTICTPCFESLNVTSQFIANSVRIDESLRRLLAYTEEAINSNRAVNSINDMTHSLFNLINGDKKKISSLCRLCAAKWKLRNMTRIFVDEDNFCETQIRNLLNLKLRKGDGLPGSICNICVGKLIMAHDFVTVTRSKDIVLRNILYKGTRVKEVKRELRILKVEEILKTDDGNEQAIRDPCLHAKAISDESFNLKLLQLQPTENSKWKATKSLTKVPVLRPKKILKLNLIPEVVRKYAKAKQLTALHTTLTKLPVVQQIKLQTLPTEVSEMQLTKLPVPTEMLALHKNVKLALYGTHPKRSVVNDEVQNLEEVKANGNKSSLFAKIFKGAFISRQKYFTGKCKEKPHCKAAIRKARNDQKYVKNVTKPRRQSFREMVDEFIDSLRKDSKTTTQTVNKPPALLSADSKTVRKIANKQTQLAGRQSLDIDRQDKAVVPTVNRQSAQPTVVSETNIPTFKKHTANKTSGRHPVELTTKCKASELPVPKKIVEQTDDSEKIVIMVERQAVPSPVDEKPVEPALQPFANDEHVPITYHRQSVQHAVKSQSVQPQVQTTAVNSKSVHQTVESQSIQHRVIDSLKPNRERKARKRYVCDICKEVLRNRKILTSHRQMVHGKGRFTCKACGKTFVVQDCVDITAKELHERITHFVCNFCKVKSSSKPSPSIHTQVRTGVHPFGCTLCPEAFKTKKRLTKHSRVHLPVQTYTCDICKDVMAHKFILICHIWKHTGERPYSCSKCPKTFSSVENLDRHFLVHTNWEESRSLRPRPPPRLVFPCDVCGNEFDSELKLTVHKGYHSRDTQHLCTACMVGFYKKAQLNRHLQTHD